MYLRNNIHWHEGLFLQPHHMQVSQKSMLDGFNLLNRNMNNYSTGVLQCKVAKEQLEVGQLQFEELKAVMPSGTYIDINENTVLKATDVKDLLEGEVKPVDVYLGIPLWASEKANTYSAEGNGDTAVKLARIYELDKVDANDENTGDNKKEIQIRKINALLFF